MTHEEFKKQRKRLVTEVIEQMKKVESLTDLFSLVKKFGEYSELTARQDGEID